MEELCFLNPSRKVIRWRCHRQDHGGDLTIKSHRELGYRGEFVFEAGLGCEIFKLVDVLLKPVIRSSIFVLSWPLDKFGQVTSSLEFGVEGVEVLIIVFSELFECLLLGFDSGVSHFIVPFLRECHSFPGVHFAKDEGDL